MGKPTSLVAEMGLVTATVAAALRGEQIQPLLLGPAGSENPLPELAGGLSGLAQVQTCNVGSPPGPGRGSRLSLEKARTQESRGIPPAPLVRARSFPLARFGGRATLFRSMGYYGAHVRTLIWRLSFAECFSAYFFQKMRPKSVLGYR